MAAEDQEKAESAAQSAVLMALGGSTKAVLHLPAIAHAAGVPVTLDDCDTYSRRVPVRWFTRATR